MTNTRIVLVALLLLAPAALHAAGADTSSAGFVPLTNIPGIEQAGNSATLPDFLNNLYKLCIGIAAILAVLQIIRAGIMYMGGDSITEKKEARSIITLSISGLILVLSPVIVFSIINPKILDLKIGVDALKPPTQTTTTTGTNTSAVPAECTNYAVRTAINPNQTCSSANGYEPIAAACCGSMVTGGTCCGRKSATNTSQPTSSWGWRAITVDSATEKQQTTQQRGPFTTQTECQTSLRDWPQANNLSIVSMMCDCTKPLSEQTNCSF